MAHFSAIINFPNRCPPARFVFRQGKHEVSASDEPDIPMPDVRCRVRSFAFRAHCHKSGHVRAPMSGWERRRLVSAGKQNPAETLGKRGCAVVLERKFGGCLTDIDFEVTLSTKSTRCPYRVRGPPPWEGPKRRVGGACLPYPTPPRRNLVELRGTSVVSLCRSSNYTLGGHSGHLADWVRSFCWTEYRTCQTATNTSRFPKR
jgi:hypothetical protein